MATWNDATSYSRGDTERTPRTWETGGPDLHIVVTRHIYHPGTWVLKCTATNFDQHDLRTDDADMAKSKALRLVADRLTKIAAYARRLADDGEG